VRTIWRLLRGIDPTERATDEDLFRRWPSGTRSFWGPWGSASACIVVCVVFATAINHRLSTSIIGAIELALIALTLAVLFWCVPIARPRLVQFANLSIGVSIVLKRDLGVSWNASPIVALLPDSDGGGWAGTKDGRVWRVPLEGVPVAHVWDPYRAFRAAPISQGYPAGAESLEPVCRAVLAAEDFIGRTAARGAQREALLALLSAETSVPILEFDAAIRVAQQLGLITPRHPRATTLRVTEAGRIWIDVRDGQLNEVQHTAESELANTTFASGPATETDFQPWVRQVINSFKNAVENTSANDLLWDTADEPADEQKVQTLAHVIFRTFGEFADVDISREANGGDGPVDFKFSKGWSSRALIEFKLLRSTHLYQGADRQLPRYMEVESVKCGFFVCIGFYESEFSEHRLEQVRRLCAERSAEHGFTIEPVFIHATKRISASRLSRSVS